MSHDLARPRRLLSADAAIDAALASFFSLTSDALLAFTRSGTITMANDTARELLPVPGENASILDVFPPEHEVGPYADVTRELPCAMDGTTVHVTCVGHDGRPLSLDIRAMRVSVNRDLFVMAATPVEASPMPSREMSDLVRANKRLSGTLDVILSTIEAGDMSELFDRVLHAMCDMMDAHAAVMYLAEGQDMRLAAASDGGERAYPDLIPTRRTIAELVSAHQRSVRYHLEPPTPEDLRHGPIEARTLTIDDTGALLSVEAASALPFAAAIATPVLFGGRIIALVFVGWDVERTISYDDARLLDGVAQYLSSQVMGAVSAMRTKRDAALREAQARLRDELAACELASTESWAALARAGEALGCALVVLAENVHQRVLLGYFPKTGDRELPLPLDELERGHMSALGTVIRITPATPLGGWLDDVGESSAGALLDAGLVGGERMAWLFLRAHGSEPLGESELAFCRGAVDTVRTLARGEQLRTHDRRISQALQQGMKNQLQHVEGICAHDIYSSATQDAFVGGDFYDLIRLPDRRACVVMGDVSGKGVEAAATSAAVKCALGAYAWQGLAPAHMVRMLNQFLLGFSRLETFATMFVGIVDLAQGTLVYCSAGHPPAMLLRGDDNVLEALGVQSGVVGAFEDMAYRDGEVTIRKGDTLLLYTDGTTEARAADGSFFGEDGLRDALMQELEAGDDLLEHLLARLDEFTSNRLEDDVAMVSLRFDEVG